MATFATLDEVKAAAEGLRTFDNADDLIRSATAKDLIARLAGSEWEFDGILLVALNTRRHVGSDSVWKFYQNIIESSTEAADAASIIADACSSVVSSTNDSKYHVIRLIYLAASEFISRPFEGHSNARLACSQVLVNMGEEEHAALFLLNLASVLLDDDERKREFVYVANNRNLLNGFIQNGTVPLKNAAQLVVDRSGI